MKQKQNSTFMVKSFYFFPKLISHNYGEEIVDHFIERRSIAYKQEFINLSRKQILMKKIVDSMKAKK